MKNKPKPVTVGSVWESKSCGAFTVTKYESATKVWVKFHETDFEDSFQASKIRAGAVLDRMKISVYGFGFIGCGKFKPRRMNKPSKEYVTWCDMIRRCYDPYNINKYPAYKDCTVCDEWMNFQNFAKWYTENQNNDNSLYIDKDIKNPGNKTYSPENCMMVTRQVNSFVSGKALLKYKDAVGDQSEGEGRFRSYCGNPFTGEFEHLGYFKNKHDAYEAWRNKKHEHAITLANQQDRSEVRLALLGWARSLKNQ
jgi:hypothetical protein